MLANIEAVPEWDSEGEAMGSIQVIERKALLSDMSRAQWYAVQTRPRHEKKVCAEMQQKHIESYLPLLTQTHYWTDRRKLVEVPLFPGYVFLRASLDPSVCVSVLRIWGVLSFVG